jgi:maltose O-acetyltransferase
MSDGIRLEQSHRAGTRNVWPMSGMRERMLRGEWYLADDPMIQADAARAHDLMERFNATRAAEPELRERLLRQLLGEVGEAVVVRPPLWIDYGSNITIGARTFVNYDCVMLDVAPIRIGSACQLATRVQLLTATHPIDPEPRRRGWEAAEPITIGDNVWLGGGAIVCPGVTIGENTVVGAGAVVTRDLPAGVVAAGVPARALREIGPTDAVTVPGADVPG